VHVSPETASARLERVGKPKVDLVIGEFIRVHGREPTSLLDVGAGAGHIVAAARARGLRAEGVEPSRIGRDSAAALYGINLRDGDITRLERVDEAFDIITFWGVLEHTTDPLEQLAHARRMLNRSAALLFLEVPRYDSFSTELERLFPNMGTRHLEAIEHIHAFSDTSVATMLEVAGFAPQFVWYLGLDWYEFAMRTLYRLGDAAAAEFVLDNFNNFQLLNDRVGLADGMIVGASPDS
jgi:SAM-dependent methyltransferase